MIARPTVQTELPSFYEGLSVRCTSLGVFRLGLDEDRDVWVGVFPEREEGLVGGVCLGRIPRQSQGSGQLQARNCAYWIGGNDAAVIENSLELRRGFEVPVRQQKGLTAQVHWIEVSEQTRPTTRYRSEEHTSELQSLRHLVCRLLL